MSTLGHGFKPSFNPRGGGDRNSAERVIGAALETL